MAKNKFPKSNLPVRKTVELLPKLFQTESNKKFMSGVVDSFVQPGVLEKTVGYIGRRYGRLYNSKDIYLDSDQTLRSRYQLEPGVVIKENTQIQNFYDYIDFKNQLKFFENSIERDDLITNQDHYSWNPPINWDKFINYREYFWVPSGPPAVSVSGAFRPVVSTYTVTSGKPATWIFSPDGFTNNPTLTLYKGNTYKFSVNAPGDNFFIRRSVDTGSSLYNPILPYAKNQIVVYDEKIYKAKVDIATQSDPIPLGQDPRWELIIDYQEDSYIDFNNGVTNNGTSNGVVTFTVPFDAPDVLYYQSATTPDRFGKFVISTVDTNTELDVEKNILGKSTYRSGNGVEFSNGLVVRFSGLVTPVIYSKDSWIVEGVGKKITLTRFQDLVITKNLTNTAPDVLFDDRGFDELPFDDASAYPAEKDYITICKSSIDANPWSRYNRWFHRSVLEFAHEVNRSSFNAPETARAKRPIIEFNPNLQLFDHGSIAKTTIDFIDTFTDDVFSKIEGSAGYIVDGEPLFNKARLLVVADTDSSANNRIYEVRFITHNNKRQISLVRVSDTTSNVGECVLVRRGVANIGLMYHFTGEKWTKSQQKIAVNQPPLFDIFDQNYVSFSDTDTYPSSTFAGCKILSYKLGDGNIDTELKFKISYLNIDNVGDIQFDFNLDQDKFVYQEGTAILSRLISTGFYRFNLPSLFENGWIKLDENFIQPIIDSVTVQEETNQIVSTALDWRLVDQANISKIIFFLNGKKLDSEYTLLNNTFTFSTEFKPGDVVSVKIFSDYEPNTGYYEIPLGLEKNPLNQEIKSFTLGQASDHVMTGLDLVDNFQGTYPGNNNLRDIDNYRTLTRRFLKHSGLAPLSIFLLCDKEINIVKSIRFAKQAYTEFKNTFITFAETLPFDGNVVNFVDNIILEIGRSKNNQSPFFETDMIGSGGYSNLIYEVEDEGIKSFALSEKFDLEVNSNRAVYLYVNQAQLLHGADYEFNSVFGYVTLKIDLAIGDLIEIREYISTANNFIPSTPTKLGLYKRFKPEKFVDNTYINPREMIQGHDGSLLAAYGDYRDDVLLELELRIYNNLKQKYETSIVDNDAIFGGYYGSATYDKQQLDSIVASEFLKWISNNNVDYLTNTFFDSENSFTYNYSNMADPSGTVNLPGYWRGVYQWFYDTDRPHRCPWEMLGFSEMPVWWEEEYGPAPYTRNNLILWEDIRDGIIRQGDTAGTYDRYKRPSILSHIPVDGDGNLLSPLDSGLARNFVLVNNQGNFKFGDISPAEHAWRSSPEWPFSIVIAQCLMNPFRYVSDNFNKSTTVVNAIGQRVNSNTRLFQTISDVVSSRNQGINTEPVSGLFLYVVDHLKSKTKDQSVIQNKIKNLDVVLSNRISGFVDQSQQKYLLDSKSPKSATSSIFIPNENYNIFFDVSCPISSISYSGVIIEKTNSGWRVSGYDGLSPYFSYFQAVSTQTDPLITVGGVSESFVQWTPLRFYGNGILVRYDGKFYRSLSSHTSGETFDIALWKQLPKAPVVGAVEALKRRNFNKLRVRRLSYGQEFNKIQDVVDFLQGYEEYQKSIGLIFSGYNSETQTPYDWSTSVKEFMFWTKHNWATGSLISLSPLAQKIEIIVPVGVAENLLDGFYDYQVYKGDGTPLSPQFIDVSRDYQRVTITTVNTDDGIYFLKVHFVLKEHIVIFDDKTVFNDIIYDKPTGYRQERIKVRGFRTTDWDGNYTSPGFVFDSVSIEVWRPFIDYKLGDIVAYKSFYWTSRFNHLGSEVFSEVNWTKLDLLPEKGLVPNFEYRINQFEDFYDVESDGVGSSQRELARHAIGYQTRDYLKNLAEDEVTQFRLYQGFIREKGTANSIVKIFDKLSNSDSDSIELNEEWAFRTGQFGGIDQTVEYEFKLSKSDFKVNPQPVSIVNNSLEIVNKQHIKILPSDFVLAPIPFNKNIIPVTDYDGITRNAGYVTDDHVGISVSTKEEILNFPIGIFSDNVHVWVTFNLDSWTVLRYNEALNLKIINVAEDSGGIVITIDRPHNILINDIVGLTNFEELTGFHQVTDVTSNTITINQEDLLELPDLAVFNQVTIGLFTEARFPTYDNITPEQIALLSDGATLWIDNNDDKWEVVKKQKQYVTSNTFSHGFQGPLSTGKSVLYVESLRQVIASAPESTYVVIYNNRTTVTDLTIPLEFKQVITPPSAFAQSVSGVFGEVLAISPDHKWLAVGSPTASFVKSRYLGDFSLLVEYAIGDIVLYQGRLWRAIDSVLLSESEFNFEKWIPETLVVPNSQGLNDGYDEQGMVSLYTYANNRWVLSSSFLSPRQQNKEYFGSSISIGVSGTNYYMAISATGSLGIGRVYLFYYNGTAWANLESSNYVGIYDSVDTNKIYSSNSIVWYNNALYQAVNASTGGLDIENSIDWLAVEPVSTQSSLPTNVALVDDGSTLGIGLLNETQLGELVKSGDGFGHAVTMSNDGSVLVISAPFSDGQYFSTYVGLWNFYQLYQIGDVVNHEGIYYQLVEASTSKNENPDLGLPWIVVGDDTTEEMSGKIYIYKKDNNQVYNLFQTINTESLLSINDIQGQVQIQTGDRFGFAIDINSSGSTLIVSSPYADIDTEDEGAVFVFNSNEGQPYRLVQKLESFERYPNELFGSSVSISPDSASITIGAKFSPNRRTIRFDNFTTLDYRTTTFTDLDNLTGQVYVFENKNNRYLLTEKLQTDLSPDESFGHSLDCVGPIIVVGSPTFKPNIVSDTIGKVRLFRKPVGSSSLSLLSRQTDLVDINLLTSIQFYDDVENIKLADIDIIDYYKLKILNQAEQEISFKTVYDPAIYEIATDEQIIDPGQAWFGENVGKLWWDLSKVKFINYEQGDVSYKIGNWSGLAEGSSIDIYEWVETLLEPTEWSVIADTADGLSLGISGQPKFVDIDVYNFKVKLNPNTGEEIGTVYYYWVKNSTIILTKDNIRKLSAFAVSSLISNPEGSGIPFAALVDQSTLMVYNFERLFNSETGLLNVQFKKTQNSVNLVHNEYQLLTDGVADSVPSIGLENKWIDSLLGVDLVGNRIPDMTLPERQRYGLNYRPRQSMFVDRVTALKIVIDNVNTILKTRSFSDLIDFKNLNSKDTPPSSLLNEYDIEVDTYIDLTQVGTVRIKSAVLSANIFNGVIDSVNIIDAGFGYRSPPTITIVGDGSGATAETTIDAQGRVTAVQVTQKGKRFSNVTIRVRPFSVLVNSDSTNKNNWSIWAWDQQRKQFYRSRSQAYNVQQYWSYVDWWKLGYSNLSIIVTEIDRLDQEPSISLNVGDLLRVKEFANGGWAILEKTEPTQGTLLDNYTLVGRQNGTIQFGENTYDISKSSIGYNGVASYDSTLYDLQNHKELRILLTSVKEDIFIDDLRVEWNKLFFTSVRYAFSEQLYVNWAFKTSFLSAIHNVGELEQKLSYRSDNLDSYKQYLDEVKPFRTTVREYTSRYTRLENTPTIITDFDLPPVYSERDGKILPVNESYNRFEEYPWKWWTDNNGYSIKSIELSNPGSDYVSPPTVVIEGNGVNAVAQAYVSNGRVSGIVIIDQGAGFTETPTIKLVGGNGSSSDIATAIAVLGNSKIRTFNTTIKFDRISKTGIYQNFDFEEEFVATGFSGAFDLAYPTSRDNSKIKVHKDQQLVLTSDYRIDFYNDDSGTNTLLKSKLIFVKTPAAGSVIKITYRKNEGLFDSVNRIENFYSPSSGMKGNELPQLMTGIDFGGVQVQGTTFEVTGGWDALPWFTDNWDSVESNNDFYYVVTLRDIVDSTLIYKKDSLFKYDGIVYRAKKENINSIGEAIFPVESIGWEEFWERFSVPLPSTPEPGKFLSIYIKRQGVQTRIDDLYYDLYDGSTVQTNGKVDPPPNAIMNSFIGDGVKNSIDFNDILELNDGDALIFRSEDSDGSVTITDINLLDTQISGGNLSAINQMYQTANGVSAEQIVIDGEKFVSPDQVPAPEENIPGQVLDSVSIKVFTKTVSGGTPIQNKLFSSNGSSRFYSIGLPVFEAASVLVYVNKIKQEYLDNYLINFSKNEIEFISAPASELLIEIISIGIGGTSLIDYQEFTADGDTTLFLTKALYSQTDSVLVSVNGEVVDTGFINSSDVIEIKDKTMIQFAVKPQLGHVIKIVSLGTVLENAVTSSDLIRVNSQIIVSDGTTREYTLDNFVNLSIASAQSSVLVNLNNVQLNNVDTVYQIYDGVTNEISIGVDPIKTPSSITSTQVKLFINDILKDYIVDYTIDSSTNLIIINADKVLLNDLIRIEVILDTEYTITGNQLIISDSVVLNEFDVIEVTWFSDYPALSIISDQYTGGKVSYKLARTPLSIDYIWVYKNGYRLIRDIDFYISLPNSVVLNEVTTFADVIKIVEFTNEIYQKPVAYEIFKDMLNTYHYKRYSITDDVKLAKDLRYYDKTIELDNAADLPEPIAFRNVPGVIVINKERIEYLTKNGNILGQLRRGSLGTGIADLHTAGSMVVNVGYTETIPYVETQDKEDFVSDGETLIIGPLEFIPVQSNKIDWVREDIPDEYGPCDQLEVFVAGRRLRKDPISVYDESLGISSPNADRDIQAEFAVDGVTPFIRLSMPAPAGTRISIIRKQGKVWYNSGESTASLGVTFLKNDTPSIKFIAQKGSELPE